MDKNFISIDDLVRQRLEGEEERERPAGWLQMRDLLDKEMPQVRRGFYWRRTFGAVALLLLATSISVGGFMFASAIKGDNATAANSKPVNNSLPISNTTSINDNRKVISANEIKATPGLAKGDAVPAHKSTANNKTTSGISSLKSDQAKKQTTSTAEPVTEASKIAAVNNTPANNVKESSNSNTAASKSNANSSDASTGYSTAVSNDVKPTDEAIVLSEAGNKNADKKIAGKKHTKSVAPKLAANTNGPKATREKSVAVTSTHPDANKHNADKADAQKKQFLTQLITANEANKKAAKMHQKVAAKQLAGVSSAISKKANKTIKAIDSDKSAPSKDGQAPEETTASGSPAYVAEDAKDFAVAQNTQHTRKNKLEKAKKTTGINTADIALGSGTPTTKAPGAIAASRVEDETDLPVTSPRKNAAQGKRRTGDSPVGSKGTNTVHDNKWSGNAHNTTKPVTGSAEIKELAAAKVERRTIDRVTMTEHYIKTSAHDGYFLLDTISIDQFTPALAANTPDPHHPNGARKNESAKEDDDNSSESSGALASANATIVPGAATAASGKSGLGTKQTQSSKGSGASTVEKLSATFNDVKYHVAGMQFSPGLTAGINGTFFGPNSFKGFQFGFTGNFTFSESIGIMTELKYFHRINNNYTLNDNYYTYTQAGGGMWSKQLSSTSYSFSTLHSIELPVSIRYSMSHFTFYAGGNFVYSFAINSGASVQPNNTAPVLVAAIGNDNAPKLHNDDFNSRLGMGYLVGLSYEVRPNVTLDFRSVQTVWDNSGSKGAKYISNQLYRSPSFQVSIGYRLGGNKKRD